MKNMFKSLVCIVVWGAISLPVMATEITPHALYGRWQCNDQNSETRLTTTKQYAINGRSSIGFSLQSLNSQPDGMPDVMEVAGTGMWQLKGSTLIEQPLNYKFSQLQIGGSDMLGSPLEAAMITEMLRQTSRVHIVELTRDRMVISPLDATQEMTCTRL